MNIQRLIPVLAFVILAPSALVHGVRPAATAPAATETQSDALLGRAFRDRMSNLQVEGRGEVVKALADDHEAGSRGLRPLRQDGPGR